MTNGNTKWVTQRRFVSDVDAHLRAVTGSAHGAEFVHTLRDYIVGLVREKLEPLEMQYRLNEFLGGKSQAVVEWLVNYLNRYDIVNPQETAASGQSRERGDRMRDREDMDVDMKPPPSERAAQRTRSRSPATHSHRQRIEFQGPAAEQPIKLEDSAGAAAVAAGGMAPRTSGAVDGLSVVVQNVHFDASADALQSFLTGEMGPGVVRATILRNMHGASKGYAYVQFQTRDLAKRALSLSGSSFWGRTLKVVPKLKQPPPSAAMRMMNAAMPAHPGMPPLTPMQLMQLQMQMQMQRMAMARGHLPHMHGMMPGMHGIRKMGGGRGAGRVGRGGGPGGRRPAGSSRADVWIRQPKSVEA